MTLRVEWLHGCGTALVTPFTATGEVDETRFRALLERQIGGGVRLLVPCGTTGEGATLDAREQERLIALTVEVAGRRARIEYLSAVNPVRLTTVPGFETCVVRFTTDIPNLGNWGAPLLIGPGSILDAHTAHERISLEQLAAGADSYVHLVRALLCGKSAA